MPNYDDFITSNKAMWDEVTPAHVASKFYNVEGFLHDPRALTLDPIELDELPEDLTGHSLIHLQCHFGMDTLSLARMGASVTGVDLSTKSIESAKQLAKQAGLNARFVASDVYHATEIIDEQFDVVFTSGGVLLWLPDLKRWAEVIDHFLKPGGWLYLREFHPFVYVFDDEHPSELRVRFSYFNEGEPNRFEGDGSYADPDYKGNHNVSYEWNHSLADIISSLTAVGLKIEYLHEFPVISYKALPQMTQRKDGYWILPNGPQIPLMFSLKAHKPL